MKVFNIVKKIQSKDIIAIVAILAFTFLKLKGLDGYVDAGFTVIIGYYFGRRMSGGDNGK